MTTAVFQRVFDGPLYALEADDRPPGWIGFVLAPGAVASETIGIKASGGLGHYVFAPTPPRLETASAASAFAAAICGWVQGNFNQALACIWLNASVGSMFGPPSSTAVAFGAASGFFTTYGNFNCAIGQLTLSVPQSVAFTFDDRGLRFSTAASKVGFTTTDGRGVPGVGASALPFVGPGGGSIALSGALSRSQSRGTLAAFEAGFHYWHGRADGGADARQVHPMLKSGDALPDLAYDGFFDPRDPFNAVPPLSDAGAGRYRTMFMPRGRAASFFADAFGHPLDLVALGGLDAAGDPAAFSGALVPQPLASVDAPAAIYLAPAGDWALARQDDSDKKPLRLLPGLFGSESIGLRAHAAEGQFDRLRFEPNRPARCPVFPLPPANLAEAGDGTPAPRLDATRVTSWAAVLDGPGGATTYAAQPEGAPLYAPDGTAATLPPLAVDARIPQPTDAALLLPIAPYAGLGSTAFAKASIGPFESQILAGERKRILGAHTVARLRSARRRQRLEGASAAGTMAATPQGLLAEVARSAAGDALYEKVLLARCLDERGALDFGFRSLSPALQNLFQTNQLMAVVTNPTALGTPAAAAGQPAFDRDVSIAGWRMTAAVGEPGATGAVANVLILKFCDGRLVDRLRTPKSWAEAETFATNGDGDPAVALAALSQELHEHVQAGIDAKDPLYANFARIATDPSWRGVLVLRARIAASGLPAQIEGLSAGIDFSRFEAHHFGVTASRVVVANGKVDVEVPSSLFALVDYELPAYRDNRRNGAPADLPVALPNTGALGFGVLQLQVLFANAAIADFKSRIQLTTGALFGSRVTAARSALGTLPVPAIVLRGTYQRQGATALYVFEQDATTVMALDSDVLPVLGVQRVVFNTLSAGADGTVRSRFLIWGTFAFALLQTAADGGDRIPVDLLSFGPLPAAAPMTDEGLAFSGLEVAMAAPVGTPNAVTFALDAGRLALDAGASVPRAASLRDDLALELEGFLAEDGDKRPIDYGFLPIDVEVPTRALEGPWFGVSYAINMGTPGALVAKAGFASRLLVAWAPTSKPGDPASTLFVGLQLPGAAPGAKLLSIQGVMKLTIDNLFLRREQVTPKRRAFVLRLSNIGITFLSIVKLPSDPINFFLFGDPEGRGSIGWYAAYRQGAGQAVAQIEEGRS